MTTLPVNYNLPPGCELRDISPPEEPTCEHPGCYEVVEGDQERRFNLCTRHLRDYLRDLE